MNPLLQEAESFRFCTVRLDLRENSDAINHTLSVIFTAMKNGVEPPLPNSKEWKKWLLEELDKPLNVLPTFSNLDELSSSTLGLFQMVAQMMDKLDNEAFGNFILSMTKTVNDILGVYFLAKITGIFSSENDGSSDIGEENNKVTLRVLINPLVGWAWMDLPILIWERESVLLIIPKAW